MADFKFLEPIIEWMTAEMKAHQERTIPIIKVGLEKTIGQEPMEAKNKTGLEDMKAMDSGAI